MKNKRSPSLKKTGKISGYSNPFEHLTDELKWLNQLLTALVSELRNANFYETIKDFRGLFIADAEIDALIASGISDKDEARNNGSESAQPRKRAGEMRNAIHEKVRLSGASLPLRRLSELFRLSDIEVQILIICLAPKIDARYERLYAYLNNDVTRKNATIDLVYKLLGASLEQQIANAKFFDHNAPLFHYHILHQTMLDSSPGLSTIALTVDSSIESYICGRDAVSENVAQEFRIAAPASWEDIVIDEALRESLVRCAHTSLDKSGRLRLNLFGKDGVGKKTIASALVHSIDMHLIIIDLRELLHDVSNFVQKLRLLLRESLLKRWAVCFENAHVLENCALKRSAIVGSFVRELDDFEVITVLCGREKTKIGLLQQAGFFEFKIPSPNYQQQEELWRKWTAGIKTAEKQDFIQDLVNRFNLSGGQILRAAQAAQKSALIRDPDNPTAVSMDFFQGCREQSQPQLTALSRKISPKYAWEDIVLPKDRLEQLRELTNQVRLKNTVLGEWGFAQKLSLGHGVSALFSGPSGTGKTMAAEVVSNALELDLYKIDLSAVVSKYIGETEKNLSRIFNEAEQSNAILFFDEADALLGKRSEVKDAHDRFANIEIAYLLQKMEEYTGVTVLSTNLKKNMDDAFMRRIQFIIEFPMPDERNRKLIWRKIYPGKTPVGESVDFEFLARQFELSGGNIKNIALSAAYLAADNGKVVDMPHLIRSTKRELQKIGRLYTKTDFGAYHQEL